jgi:8-oxo-dGTP pyrophosphatase MutT (NUDIX family)
MPNLLNKNAKICLTAAGCLVHEGRVLLVKHKKVKTWLNPGGHIEDNEAPHVAAEREFWEETGVTVEAYDLDELQAVDESDYLPNPYATNLHWISKPNFAARQEQQKNQQKKTAQKSTNISAEHQADEYLLEPQWSRGCEQHLNFMYLVKPTGSLDFKENVEETDGIAWFTPKELKTLDLFPNVLQEIELAFKLSKK